MIVIAKINSTRMMTYRYSYNSFLTCGGSVNLPNSIDRFILSFIATYDETQ
jgi:hypothetical protein